MNNFITNNISMASYLMAAKNVKLLEAKRDNNIHHIVLDVSPEEASVLLNDFPTSESARFDNCVEFLKKKIYPERYRR